jgi:hypothetical protein
MADISPEIRPARCLETLPMPHRLSRREFVRALAVGSAAFPLTAASWSRVLGANDRLRVASIGCGGKGVSDVNGVASSPHVQVVALCNIDEGPKHLCWAAEK